MNDSPAAIILAAGKGTRMKSDLPKVVHSVAGEPMVRWVVRACRDAGCDRIIVVVGHRQELVREALSAEPVEFAVQSAQLGTGHAVQQAQPALAGRAGDVIVLAGDGPLVRAESLHALLNHHRTSKAGATLATAEIEDPTGYGRIIRDNAGRFLGVVEHKDASETQHAIREINPSVYCFDAAALFAALARVTRSAGGEFYLTDAPALIAQTGADIEAVRSLTPEEAVSINTPEELATADRLLRARQARAGAA